MSNEIAERAAFVAVDLETTGLSVDDCSIIEIGVVVADVEMNPITSYQSLVAPVTDLSEMDEFVREMHEGNGLLADLERMETYAGWYPEDIALDARYWLTDVCGLESGKFPLTGSSVGFDRLFMRRYMPKLEEFFHYRTIDLSTVKELVKVWTPDIKWKSSGQKAHRSVDDIYSTLEEGRFYREQFFT